MNIEDDNKSIVGDAQKDLRPSRGRKPAYESRATELRQTLIFWQQTPESLRPSLRALARANNTSHQLLTFYLKGLKEWQYEERYRNAKQRATQRAEEIRRRAAVERRDMTMEECLDGRLGPGWIEQVESLRQAAKRGPLNWYQGQMLKIYARWRVLGAEELLRQCLQDGLLKRKSFAEIVRGTSRREDEPPNDWVRRIWDECAKYGTACPTVITEEILAKYSRGKSEDLEEKFPTSAETVHLIPSTNLAGNPSYQALTAPAYHLLRSAADVPDGKQITAQAASTLPSECGRCRRSAARNFCNLAIPRASVWYSRELKHRIPPSVAWNPFRWSS